MRTLPPVALLALSACTSATIEQRPCSLLPSTEGVSLDDRLASGRTTLRTLVEEAEADAWRVLLPDGSMRPDVVVDMRVVPTGAAWRYEWGLGSDDDDVVATCPLPSTVDLPVRIDLSGRLWEDDITVFEASYDAILRVEDARGDTYFVAPAGLSSFDPRQNPMGEIAYATHDWMSLPEACGTHRAYQTFAPVADLVTGSGLWPEPTFQFTWQDLPDDCYPIDPLITLVQQ